jgi:hypothetical protein
MLEPIIAFPLNGGPFIFPMNIRLTSVRNDTVLDVLESEYGGQVGSAAWPVTPSSPGMHETLPSPLLLSASFTSAGMSHELML